MKPTKVEQLINKERPTTDAILGGIALVGVITTLSVLIWLFQ